MIAVRRVRRFDPARSAFETWIAGIAWNVLRDARRREARRSRRESTATDLEASVEAGAGTGVHAEADADADASAGDVEPAGALAGSPAAPLERGTVDERDEDRSRVTLVLASLSAGYRDVLQAKYGSGESIAAIAERLGKSPKAIESLLGRAREAFRRAYAQLPGG